MWLTSTSDLFSLVINTWFIGADPRGSIPITTKWHFHARILLIYWCLPAERCRSKTNSGTSKQKAVIDVTIQCLYIYGGGLLICEGESLFWYEVIRQYMHYVSLDCFTQKITNLSRVYNNHYCVFKFCKQWT